VLNVSGERGGLTSTLGVFSVCMKRLLLGTTDCRVRRTVVARPGRLPTVGSAEIERAGFEVNVLLVIRGSTHSVWSAICETLLRLISCLDTL